MGGKTSVPHSWPWIVHISTARGSCAGTLLKVDSNEESDIVLTAAHCVYKANGNIYFKRFFCIKLPRCTTNIFEFLFLLQTFLFQEYMCTWESMT